MKVKEPEGFSSKSKKSKKASQESDSKQGNIKELLGGRGSPPRPTSADKKSTSGGLKTFSGQGHVLQPHCGGRVGDTVDLTGGPSLREKMLAAAEKRLKDEQERGVQNKAAGRKPQTVERGGRGGEEDEREGSGDLRKLWKRGTNEIQDTPPQKKSRHLSSEHDHDCQVIDSVDVTPSTKNTTTASSKHVLTNADLETSAEVIVLDNVADYPTSSRASSGSPVKHRTCPICFRTDIPEAVLGVHVGFCLEEMEIGDSDDEEGGGG